MPRKSEFTQDVADVICERIAEGESLRSICKDEKLPSLATVFKWLTQQPAFAEQYARAREEQADALADEILHIADTPKLGVKTKINEKGEIETTEADMIEHRRLQVDARKWIAAKLKPKKYGDKISQELTGKDGGPIKHEVALTAEEAYKRMLDGGS